MDNKELYPYHADFLSRLGLTFSHGDYARLEQIKDKDRLAASLYHRALQYWPDHRAYLGLGMLRQKHRQYEDSLNILEQGLEHFPESEALHTCLGISYLNLGDYRAALAHFPENTDSKEIKSYINICREALKGR